MSTEKRKLNVGPTLSWFVRSWHSFSTSASLEAGTMFSDIFSTSKSSRPNPSMDRPRRLALSTGRPWELTLPVDLLDLVLPTGLSSARFSSYLLMDFRAVGLG